MATILSLTGVFVAGSAAALVNTQVLRNAAPAANSVSQLVSASDESSTSADVITVPGPSSSATTSTVAADDVKIYEVQGTGRVTLDKSKDVLRIVSVEGIAPWQPLSQRQVDGQRIEVRFVNGEAVVVFAAALAGDEITYELKMESLATGSSVSAPSPSSSSETSVPRGSTPSSASTPTSVDSDDDDSKATTSTDDSGGKGGSGGGGGGDDDHPSDDD